MVARPWKGGREASPHQWLWDDRVEGAVHRELYLPGFVERGLGGGDASVSRVWTLDWRADAAPFPRRLPRRSPWRKGGSRKFRMWRRER